MDQIPEIKQSKKDTEWAQRIQSCHESGKTITAWCRENGISPKAYYYHLRKVRELPCEQKPIPVAEVCGREDNTITLRIADIRVEIPGTVSAEYLASVIRGLKC